MEYLLSSKPLFKSRREENSKPKNKILYKFKIIEEKNKPINLRNNYFIKYNQITDISNIKNKRTRDSLPLINTKENKTLLNIKINEDNTIKNMKCNNNIRYKSKEELIKSTLLPYTRKKSSINNKRYINNNSTCCSTEIRNKKILSKKISIKINNSNNSQTKKGNSLYDDFLEEEEKNDLKLIKLNRINNNILDKPKNHLCRNRYKGKEYEEDQNNKPIKIIINNNSNDNNCSQKDKIIIGSKYSTFDISPDSVPKNMFYSRLNTYYDKINEKNNNGKKINLSKLDFHNIKLKSFHNQKMKQCKRMIEDTVKEVNDVKNYCLNWVNELREQYSDLYKGCGIENKEE